MGNAIQIVPAWGGRLAPREFARPWRKPSFHGLPPTLRGLGAGNQEAAGIAQGAATIASEGVGEAASGAFGASAEALAAGPAGAIIVGVAVLAEILTKYIGGGCGAACTDGAMVEQIYESAADNIYLAGKLGMLSSAEAVAGMQPLIQAAAQHEAQFNTTQSKNGAANAAKTINAEIADAQSLPQYATIPIDLSAAHAVYVGGSGWYPASAAAGAQLADAYLTSLANNPDRTLGTVNADGTVSAPASTATEASVLGISVSSSDLFLALILAAGGLYLATQ